MFFKERGVSGLFSWVLQRLGSRMRVQAAGALPHKEADETEARVAGSVYIYIYVQIYVDMYVYICSTHAWMDRWMDGWM